METVRAFCIAILESGDLETKLRAPRSAEGHRLTDAAPGAAVLIERPARAPGLRMTGGASKLPRPRELARPEARVRCLARFAHHELMAVELFAWALLRWPDAPAALRRGLLGALADEQRHCRLYLERLEAHGADFTTFEHSDYFWRQAPAIAGAPEGVASFLAAMGLTLEQANLDFTLVYRDGFQTAGDAASAAVCQQVYDDEVTHVALAAHWVPRLVGCEDDPIAAYEAAVPFPLAANRAKGRRFDVTGRRNAGLSEPFIRYVREARSSQERAGGGAAGAR